MHKKIVRIFIAIFILFVCFQYFYGRSPGSGIKAPNQFDILAHRGVHVNWKPGAYDPRTGCEAAHIYEPTHEYLENTIESIGAAFNLGATIVEIDIRRTGDDQLVVFHDDRLECRTNGNGKVADHPLEYLKNLDIGYGFTYDDGKTFPFRGKGLGKMTTLVEVLQNFPDKKFLIDDKDGSLQTVEVLVRIMHNLPSERQKLLYYWGRPETFALLQKETPAVKRLLVNRSEAKKWFKKYLITFGLSEFPKESQDLVFVVPLKYTKFIWGWPYRFMQKVHHAGARLYLMIDSEIQAQQYADFPADGIVTDYIEIVGRYFQHK